MSRHQEVRRTTVTRLQKLKAEGEKIACLTAYDASFARALDAAGVDVILVGDSLGMVVQGHDTTVPVTVEDVLYHTRCVARGCERALLMADMPFMSYPTPERALDNAARFLQEGGAQMVKLEGGAAQEATVRLLALNGIPVCAHLGLKPQSIHKLGAYRVQGREAAAADAMVRDALALAEAGADLLLLECVPSALADRIRDAVTIPVIGIGAGAGCDGQILVLHDVLGLTGAGDMPRFAKDFLAGNDGIEAAVRDYVEQVKAGRFPAAEHAF
ncbi:MAG TPA: 3-methyl-2-oxobutanoate hydroxymethyltransferase [Thioalkalivibrio sp.]|nr:3-methyl-2-oxobutanoate hydroxymethyltransferase [Thioalkalivibrio sp.]